jgi:hypothetical protein
MIFKKKIRDDVVYVANGSLEAETIKALLESFGIKAYINQESAGLSYGLTVGPLAEAEVVVDKKDLADARQIIAKMESGELEQE